MCLTGDTTLRPSHKFMPHRSTRAEQAIHDNGVLSLDDESAPEEVSGPPTPFQSARWLGFRGRRAYKQQVTRRRPADEKLGGRHRVTIFHTFVSVAVMHSYRIDIATHRTGISDERSIEYRSPSGY